MKYNPMKNFLMSILLTFAVCTPAFAHNHVGVYIQSPGLSIGYHNGWHRRGFDVRVYPPYPSYPVYPYSQYPSYPAYQYPHYTYEQIPTYCVDYYGNPYVCGYHTVVVPAY